MVGNIPREICFLKQLKFIAVHANKLSGTFLSCLYNMSSLTGISVAANSFSGSLPIPTSIANAYTLIRFDIGGNHFVGQVPCLGKLQKLWSLSLQDNKLGDNSSKDLEFLKSFANWSQLYSLSVTNNHFGGSLPNLIGNLSPGLSELYIGGNQIYGKIPIELGNLTSLILLTMEDNRLEGTIPKTFGMFQKIQYLGLGGNRLSGDIPAFIGNLSRLYYIGMRGIQNGSGQIYRKI